MQFDSTLPPDAAVSCTDSSQCPAGRVCQLSLGACVSPALVDLKPPGLLVSPLVTFKPKTTYLPNLAPLAAGPHVDVEIRLVANEPLLKMPTAQIESSVPQVSCTLASSDAVASVVTCTVERTASGTGVASVSVTLTGLANQSAVIEVARFEVDAESPPAPGTMTREEALLSIRPWGDINSANSVASLELSACVADQRLFLVTPTSESANVTPRFVQCIGQRFGSDFTPDVTGASLKAFGFKTSANIERFCCGRLASFLPRLR